MTVSPDILVFSDLDGTLLDHRDYSWQPAQPALDRLRDLGAGLILSTSKTAKEVAPIRESIGFAEWPAIVENGGGLLEAGQTGKESAGPYDALRNLIEQLPNGFRGFGDMTVTEIADQTGLSIKDATNAKARQFSEPGLWTAGTADLEPFLRAAAQLGLSARQGGRFLTLSFGGSKADRMDALIHRYRPKCTLALGDAPNDVEMLEKVDFGVIVRNEAGPNIPQLDGEFTGRITRTLLEGPTGWTEAISAFLNNYDISKESRRHG